MTRGATIKGWVIFLLCAGAVTLANPLFWRNINPEFGAAPYRIIEADGARRDAISGPKGPWPSWARAPGETPVRPAVSYSAAPGHAATGFGDAGFNGDALTAARATAAMLEAAGWTVEETRKDFAYPSLPPQPYAACVLTARRADAPDRYLHYAFQMAPKSGMARIRWADGAPAPKWFDPPSDCSKQAAAAS